MASIRKLLADIHSRSIWQVLGSYGVGAWLVLQLADTLSSLIGLPLWFGSTVVVLLALGFPLILATVLVQSATTQGAARTVEAASWLRRNVTWRNASLLAGVAIGSLSAGTAGYMGMRVSGLGPVGTLLAKGVLQEQERVILSQLDNRTGDPGLGEAVTALLRIDLAQSPTVLLLEPAQMAPILARMELPAGTALTFDVAREAAEREGVKAVVAGELLPLGEGFVLSARVVAVGSGDVLVAARRTASRITDVPDAVDRLSAELRERIGESLRTIQGDRPLEQVTTGSIDALRRYAQAELASDEGDVARAISLLEAALADDSTFAMAHRKLGVLLTNYNQQPERARQAFTAAFGRRTDLTDRERYLAEAAYHTYVEHDLATANDAYESLLERYPTDPVALNNLAVNYQGLGRLEDALALSLRSIELRVAPAVTYANAIELQVQLGSSDSAEATLRRFADAFPENSDVLRHRVALAGAGLDYRRAQKLALELRDAVRGDPIRETRALLLLANITVARGQLQQGVALLTQVYDVQERFGFVVVPQPRAMWEAEVAATAALVFSGDREAAVEALERVEATVAWDSLPAEHRGYLSRASLYAQAGMPETARRLVGEYRATVADDVQDRGASRMELHGTLGTIALAEGRFADAIEEFRAGREALPECVLCQLYDIAAAYDRAEKADSAVAAYERYLATPALFRGSPDNLNLWRVLLRLGELLEAQGEAARAARYYDRFIELWSDADDSVQPRVEAARARLQRLSG